MRYLSFRKNSQKIAAGILLADTDSILDLSHPSCISLLGDAQPNLLDMVKAGLEPISKRIKESLKNDPPHKDAVIELKDVTFCAPIPNPGKIVGAAYNFTDALDERSMPYPSEPVIFIRSGLTTIGPHDSILIPPDVGNVGYEAELAVVMGKRALHIGPDKVMSLIAGFTAHNDVSGSGMIKEDKGNFVRGKNMPASAPFGPYLVTPDEVGDPYAIDIELMVDGKTLQDGSTAKMYFKIAELISFISKQMPLEPGDIIATGTPGGLAMVHSPPAWLLPGQVVEVNLSGIGSLNNPVKQGAPYFE
jgi:2,4-diketo-3-deoxy-L-fuconate hydrolase